MDADYRVHLANPAAIQQYSGLKYTDDHSDARWLAHLLRLGVLPEGYIYPKAERAVRDLLRKRAHVVRQHTANVLSVQNIMARNTGARFSVKRMQELTKEAYSQNIRTRLPTEGCAPIIAHTSTCLPPHHHPYSVLIGTAKAEGSDDGLETTSGVYHGDRRSRTAVAQCVPGDRKSHPPQPDQGAHPVE